MFNEKVAMNKNIDFRWVSFTGDHEQYIGAYANTKIINAYVALEVGLTQMVEAAKYAEKCKKVQMLLGSLHSSNVCINGLTDPIELKRTFKVGDYNSEYSIASKGPSVQWISDNRESFNNPNPSKLLYTDNMVAYFEPFDDKSTTIAFLKIDDMEHILRATEGSLIEWLGYKTFDIFLASYGYTDKIRIKDLTLVLMLYKAAKILKFENAEEAITHFCDKQLIAELKLKGVFEGLKKRYY